MLRLESDARGVLGIRICVAFVVVVTGAGVTAAMDVNVMPDGIRVAGTNTAYAKAGEALSVWGNVRGGTAPYTYVWAFGDGSPNVGGGVANPREIEAVHAYASTGTFFATLTVTDTLGTSSSDTVRVDVVVDDQARRVNAAVQRGLRYLYRSQNAGGWWSGWPAEAYTAAAVQAFEIRGHLPTNDADEDIYAETVAAGLDYLFSVVRICPIGPQPAGDPDSDGDGEGVYWSDYAQYTSGIVMLAVAASSAPSRVVTAGPRAGETYYGVMVDAVDYLAWAQNEGFCGSRWEDWASSDFGYLYGWSDAGGEGFGDGEGGVDQVGAWAYFYAERYGNLAEECESGSGFLLDFGDGSPIEAVYPEGCDEGWAYSPYPGWSHFYAPGDYTACVYWDYEPYSQLGAEDMLLCCLSVNVAQAGGGEPQHGRGGWRYAPNTECSSDNSVTQWPVIGLKALESAPWSLFAPSWVLEELNLWTTYSQYWNPGDWYDGAFGYDGPWSITKASCGSGLCQLAYLGADIMDSRVQGVLAYINRDWDWDNWGNLYSMYAFAKGARISNPPVVTLPTVGNWQSAYNDWLVANQQADGSWSGPWAEVAMNTAWGIEILTQTIAELVPVAVAEASPMSTPPHAAVTLVGTASYHQDPARSIVAYRWDFDASDGVDMVSPDATGAMAANAAGYPETGADYVVDVTLEVEDDVGRTDRDIVHVTVTSGNVAPVADPGGPYAGGVGEPIEFNGSASYDPNEQGRPGELYNDTLGVYDQIVLYEWDFDGDGSYDFASAQPDASHTYGAVGTYTLKLRVTDTFGLSDTGVLSVTTVAVSDLWLVEYRFGPPAPGYSTRRGLRTEWKQVRVENRGTGNATGVSARIVNVPPEVSVVDGTVTFGDVPAGATVWCADTCTIRFALADLPRIDFSQIMWDVEFTDALGTRRLIRNVPQFP